MSPLLNMRALGGTGLSVSAITLGGGPLGSMPALFEPVPERTALELIRTVFLSEIRTIDTSNGYSEGRSEERIGRAIAEFGELPDDFLVITKVDPRGGDYSGDRVRRSLDESRQRLGMDFLPMVHLHDPEFHDFSTLAGPGGAVEALVKAREAGEIGHIGVAGGDTREIMRYVELGVFEVVLSHNRWTLVDRSAGPLIQRATEMGMAVVNAAVLGGGLLTDSAGGKNTYGYRPAQPATLEAAASMREVCTRWGTNLATAAIRFSVREPRVTTTVVGMSQPRHVNSTLDSATIELPEEFWDQLEALLPGPQHWLDAAA
jgi:D-threo-aldose 1-dehydrogenase